MHDILKTPELFGVNWAILEDKVFDLDHMVHPGGNYILKHIKGNSISKPEKLKVTRKGNKPIYLWWKRH